MSSAARDLRRAEDDSGHQAVCRLRVRREGPGSAGTARASPWGVCLRAGPGRGRGHPGRPRRRVDSVVWAPQQGCYCGNGEDALSLSLRLASHPNAAARCQAGRVEAGPRAPAGPGVSVEPRTARPAPSRLQGDVECGPLPPPQSGTGHPKGGGAPRQLAGEPGRSEEGALRRAAQCGRQGTPRHLGCSRPGLRLPSAGPVARAGSWGRRPPAGGAGRVASVSHACHNAWLALPASVIEIHCQIY